MFYFSFSPKESAIALFATPSDQLMPTITMKEALDVALLMSVSERFWREEVHM